MRNSIIFKTIFFVSLTLILVMGIVQLYVYKSQNEIINNLQQTEKKAILNQFDTEAKMKIAAKLNTLKELADSLKISIGTHLYNSDMNEEKILLKQLLEKTNIKYVIVYDSTLDEVFISGYKENGKIVFTKKVIKKFLTNNKLKYILKADGEKIGYLEIYYDNKSLIEEINKKKQEKIKKLNEEIQQTQNLIKEKLIQQLIIMITGIIGVLLTIIILLNKLVKKPLKNFQEGLNSFFRFLKNPKEQIKKIDYKSDDEFGQMAKSVNESIEVSMKLHSEIANLMNTLDKYVITSETNNKGIITYVSQAFCDITGYTKEELIGKTHNLIRDPNMDESIYTDLWDTIKNGKVWKGEIKNRKKDGSSYWVYSIITPKCKSNGENCGYTAIRFDITAQKQVEELTKNLEKKVIERTKDLEEAKKIAEELHNHTRDSINYASLIQGAVVSQEEDMKPFFKDSFVYWEPKDTVGGDIWFIEELRHKDECLLFVIDCTGHGVPGAFVTMIVKAIEREIISSLRKHKEFDISPAMIMSRFNKTMKMLLKQTSPDSKSNAGFDGGIIYYNRRTQILKFAGAETPLFYVDKDEIKTIKGNRYSVGYKKCDMNYEYKEHIINVNEDMKFYITTDGFLDQNGGEKGFPFGKKRFKKIIEENHNKPMKEQKEIFVRELLEYQKDNERNDDVTVVGFEIDKKSDYKEDVMEEIFKYEGRITQNLIATVMDNIEAKIDNMKLMGIISTITIEYCQNMMNYSKDDKIGSRDIIKEGEIEIVLINNEKYEISARNIISKEDKDKIEPKLQEIKTLDKAGIKKRYRELRKSGKNTHEKGGGIGMYEIAKVSDEIRYNFIPLNEDKFIFIMKSSVNIKREKKSKIEKEL